MKPFALCAMAAATLVAACATSPFMSRVHSVTIFPAYTSLGFSAFAAAGPTVEFRGPLPGDATPEAIAAALRLPGFYPQTPFRAAAPSDFGQRIVLAFGAAGGDTPALCAAPASGSGVETPGRLEVAAAFCNGASPLSVARLSDARPLAPDDPAFTAALRSLFAEMAPTRDPSDNNRRDACILPPC